MTVTKKPRPGKNSDGQKRKPEAAPTPRPQQPPGAVNPMTHANHPSQQPPAAPMGAHDPKATGKPSDQRQVQERINLRDVPPPLQGQLLQQQGVDPNAPTQQLQSQLGQTMAQGPSQGPIPNEFNGPNVPPGVQSFPDDMAHLHTLMQQGFGPGASPQEHELAQNARAIAAAHTQAAETQAQDGALYAQRTQELGQHIHQLGQMGQLPAPQDVAAHVASMGAPAGGMPGTPPAMAPPAPGLPPGPPMPPQLGSDMAGPPPQQPGGIPPELIAALMQDAKRKKRP